MMNKLMKKIAIAFAAATMALGAFAGSASAQECNKTEFVTAGDYLAVRTAPDASSQEVGRLQHGADVQVIDTDNYNGWTKIAYNGYQRYVCSSYLSESKPADSQYSWLKTESNTATKQTYTVHVDNGYLALRNSPSFDNSNEIAQLQNGTTVELINNGEGTYWSVRVPSTNQSGYVNSNYLV